MSALSTALFQLARARKSAQQRKRVGIYVVFGKIQKQSGGFHRKMPETLTVLREQGRQLPMPRLLRMLAQGGEFRHFWW